MQVWGKGFSGAGFGGKERIWWGAGRWGGGLGLMEAGEGVGMGGEEIAVEQWLSGEGQGVGWGAAGADGKEDARE